MNRDVPGLPKTLKGSPIRHRDVGHVGDIQPGVIPNRSQAHEATSGRGCGKRGWNVKYIARKGSATCRTCDECR